MSVIHSGVMNEYQQREYPQDTPEEKAARMEGFEAGRQYEASLREGVLLQAGTLADRLERLAKHADIDTRPGLCVIIDELRGKNA
jgi:uncharacterized membrane protein